MSGIANGLQVFSWWGLVQRDVLTCRIYGLPYIVMVVPLYSVQYAVVESEGDLDTPWLEVDLFCILPLARVFAASLLSLLSPSGLLLTVCSNMVLKVELW